MKINLLLFFLCGLLISCTANRGGQSTIDEVRSLEDKWMTALQQKDTAFLSQVISDDFLLNGSSPVAETKDQYLGTSAMPERTLEPIELSDRSFHRYQNTVVSSGTALYRGNWKQNAFHFSARYTNVYVYSKGRWRVVAAHVSSISS